MPKTAVRLELEAAYRERMKLQDLEGHEAEKLENAGRVIAAWEAVSWEVTGWCQKALTRKHLTVEHERLQ